MNTLIAAFCFSVVSSQFYEVSDNLDLGNPGQCDTIVDRDGYAAGFSREYMQPLWVSYRLTAFEVTNTVVARKGYFFTEHESGVVSASPEDYTNTGYDRGHMAPANDMRFSTNTMYESFSMVNISPQVPEVNRGIWKSLEEHVRNVALSNGAVVVVTGPLFYTNKTAKCIGKKCSIRVPDAFYKAVYVECDNPFMNGYVIPNEITSLNFTNFEVSVDTIESLSGLDLFSRLPNDIQEHLESGNH